MPKTEKMADELCDLVGYGVKKRKLEKCPELLKLGTPLEVEALIRKVVARMPEPDRQAYELLLASTRRGRIGYEHERRREAMKLVDFRGSLREWKDEEEPRWMYRLAEELCKPRLTVDELAQEIERVIRSGKVEDSSLDSLQWVKDCGGVIQALEGISIEFQTDTMKWFVRTVRPLYHEGTMQLFPTKLSVNLSPNLQDVQVLHTINPQRHLVTVMQELAEEFNVPVEDARGRACLELARHLYSHERDTLEGL